METTSNDRCQNVDQVLCSVIPIIGVDKSIKMKSMNFEFMWMT